MADSREAAGKAFDSFLETYGAKYPKACECLAKDREELLTFYEFPAEHWKHLRTTNSIESDFKGVRRFWRRSCQRAEQGGLIAQEQAEEPGGGDS